MGASPFNALFEAVSHSLAFSAEPKTASASERTFSNRRTSSDSRDVNFDPDLRRASVRFGILSELQIVSSLSLSVSLTDSNAENGKPSRIALTSSKVETEFTLVEVFGLS
ncbi:MAG: hypothetical protein WEB58_05530 [Planctomycetaceae bacterium]